MIRAGIAACLLAAAVASPGCGDGEPVDEIGDRLAQLENLVPASGVVRVDGKPAPGVVIALFSGSWAPAHGETDEEGRYTLETAARPGAVPGTYKVTLSRLISTDGVVLGLADRSGFTPNPAVATATEEMPADLASMDRTALTVTIPPGGSESLDFNVEAPPKPEAETEAPATPAEAGATPATTPE
ncbi:hypothetical protein [Paludisphaera sp.]|uniref:hypothetical protein n=1 Tax=Paludisphaera sp. TaxID=2017432 RepID=UPI00301D042C